MCSVKLRSSPSIWSTAHVDSQHCSPNCLNSRGSSDDRSTCLCQVELVPRETLRPERPIRISGWVYFCRKMYTYVYWDIRVCLRSGTYRLESQRDSPIDWKREGINHEQFGADETCRPSFLVLDGQDLARCKRRSTGMGMEVLVLRITEVELLFNERESAICQSDLAKVQNLCDRVQDRAIPL